MATTNILGVKSPKHGVRAQSRRRRRLSSSLGGILAAVVAAATVMVFGFATPPATASAPTETAAQVRFGSAMRALWEAHGTWTERAIVDYVGNLPDTNVVITQLLANQTDIGNAVKPYYGNAAGDTLTSLLKAHINDAVAVLEAAKSGNSAATSAASATFYANGVQVAMFLHAANPHHWSLASMETMMRIHLDQVVGLATDQLEGQYAAGVTLYGAYIDHILSMADMLSTGIEQQFPAKFS
jgi:hypothetical protein